MIEDLIRASSWWQQAAATHDRHYPEDCPFMVADHLLAVRRNVEAVFGTESSAAPGTAMREALAAHGIDSALAVALLGPVALLHDIGKPVEYANRDKPRLEGEVEPPRHPAIGAGATLELLPASVACRSTIAALVEEHDTPYAWYRQSRRGGGAPKRKAWEKLGRKIWPADPCTGIALLAAFKLCDIDGHEDVSDVVWFLEQANSSLLGEQGRALPVPSADEIRALR